MFHRVENPCISLPIFSRSERFLPPIEAGRKALFVEGGLTTESLRAQALTAISVSLYPFLAISSALLASLSVRSFQDVVFVTTLDSGVTKALRRLTKSKNGPH